MKKRSAHQTSRRKKGFFKGVGDTNEHIGFITIKLVWLAPPPITNHERAAYNWNGGMLE